MQVSIQLNESGLIELIQDEPGGESPYANRIEITPDQVDQVCEWLKQLRDQKP